jgi:DUF1009 family protein
VAASSNAAGPSPGGSEREALGLLAGGGGLPAALARAARRRGQRVHAAGFPDLTDTGLADHVDRLSWHPLGAISELLAEWREAGIRSAMMAGKVPKTLLVRDGESLALDATAREAISKLVDRRDDSILLAVVGLLEANGITLRPQAELVPELLAGRGVLGQVEATPEQLSDIAFGWPVAKAISGLDIGQSVVVSGRAVLAIEAIEGTDEAIRRGAELGGPGACVVKVAKPDQDPRFDLPAIGLETLRVLVEVGAGALAVEAGRTLLLDLAELTELADRHGIALIGVPPEGPTQ